MAALLISMVPQGRGGRYLPFSPLPEGATNYYRRFPGDYGRDTQHLTFEQHGAYTLLLDIAYTTEKPLPFDRELIYRMTRAISASEKASIDLVMEQFFVKSRWGYIQKRVSEEIKFLESRAKAARDNGKMGGRPKTKEKPSGFSTGTQQKPNGYQKPNPEKSSPDSILPDASFLNFSQDLSNIALTIQGADAPIVPVALWLSFVEMRKKIRKPLTDHGGELIRRELQKLKDAGEDPIAVIEQSISNSWAGVFPVRKENSNGRHESFEERRQRQSEKTLCEVRARVDEVVREVDITTGIKSNNQIANSSIRRGSN